MPEMQGCFAYIDQIYHGNSYFESIYVGSLESGDPMDAKTLCLAVLSRGDASGYEIKKKLEEPPFSHFQDTGFGSIYPALSALSNEELVSGRAMPQDKRPDKKVYAITPSGRTALVEALARPPAPDRFRSDFLFLLFMADQLEPERLRLLIDERIAVYDARIAAMEGCSPEHCAATLGHDFVHGFGLSIYRAARDYLVANREAFLERVEGKQRLVAE